MMELWGMRSTPSLLSPPGPLRPGIVSPHRVLSMGQIVLYCHLQHHNDTIIKMQEEFFINICISHFIIRVRKGLLKVCVWEGVGNRTESATFWPLLLWPSALCVSCSPDAQPEGPAAQLSAKWWLSLLHLISIFSGPQLIRAPSPFGLVWLSLPHLVYNSVSNWNWNWNCHDWVIQ